MAEKVLKKLEEQLNCTICLDTYTDPKLLQCFHVYCQQCLVKLVARDQQGQPGLTCPTCRQVTPIPDRGVAGLQSAFHINRFLDIRESFQNPEAGAAPTDVNPVKKVSHCIVHEGKELELYCETCGELICLKCALKGGKHHDHDYEELNQAFEKYKVEITASFEPMEKQVMTIKKVLAQLDTRCGEISDQRAATEDNIHVTFRRLREVLNVRETELISQLDKLTQGKLKGLAAQRYQIETTLAQLISCLHFMRESLKIGNEEDMLMMKTNTLKQVKELTTPFQPDILKPNTEANTVFSALADMTAMCWNYGQILESAKKAAKLRVEELGAPIRTIHGVRQPWGVAITQRGEVVITEWGGHCFSVFSPSGEKLRSFGTRGSGQGQFQGPHGVAVDDEGNILVVDTGNNRIQKFTAEGHFMSSVGTKGSGPLQFNFPTDIIFNAKVYVTDTLNDRVQVLNSDFTFFSTFRAKGIGKGQFHHPTGLADSTGKVYVADLNHRIQVFTAKGKFLRMFGRRGQGRGELEGPYGITIDTSDMVYVSEANYHRISVFTSEGQFVTKFGTEGEGPGEFKNPLGLAVDDSGVVYVCDWGNNRVQLF